MELIITANSKDEMFFEDLKMKYQDGISISRDRNFSGEFDILSIVIPALISSLPTLLFEVLSHYRRKREREEDTFIKIEVKQKNEENAGLLIRITNADNLEDPGLLTNKLIDAINTL